MKRLALLAVVFSVLAAPSAMAEKFQWDIDANHSSVGFVARHMAIAKVRGQFKTWDAKVLIDEGDLRTAEISIDIDAASIDTDNERRDNDLKAPHFFDAKKFPKLKFVPKSIKKKKGNHYTMVGKLTIRDVTKIVVIEWDASPVYKDPGGNEHIAFSGTTTINRFDYGLKWSKAAEGGGLVVSEEIQIELEIALYKKRKPDAKS